MSWIISSVFHYIRYWKVLYIRDPSGSNIQDDVELKKIIAKVWKQSKSETFESAYQFDDPKKS